MVAIGQILNEVASATADYSGPVASKECCALLPIRGSLSASSSVWSSWLTVEQDSGTTGTRNNTVLFLCFSFGVLTCCRTYITHTCQIVNCEICKNPVDTTKQEGGERG